MASLDLNNYIKRDNPIRNIALKSEFTEPVKKPIAGQIHLMEHLDKFASGFTSVNLKNINFKKNIGTNFDLIPRKTMLKLVCLKESKSIKELKGQNSFP